MVKDEPLAYSPVHLEKLLFKGISTADCKKCSKYYFCNFFVIQNLATNAVE